MTTAQRIAAQVAFLEAYEHTANILRAAEQAEVSRDLVYYWLEHDERFLFAYNLADVAANAHIEAEIRRRAIEGIEEPVVSQGMIAYEWDPVLDEQGEQQKDSKGKPMYRRGRMLTTRKYSDTLLIFYAKRRMPEYREKSQLDVNATHADTQALQAKQERAMAVLERHPEVRWELAEALAELERAGGSARTTEYK